MTTVKEAPRGRNYGTQWDGGHPSEMGRRLNDAIKLYWGYYWDMTTIAYDSDAKGVHVSGANTDLHGLATMRRTLQTLFSIRNAGKLGRKSRTATFKKYHIIDA